MVAIDDSKIIIDFETGGRKIFDVAPYIKGSWYGLLADKSYFRSVHVSHDEPRTVEWADGQDISPHELYENSVLI